MESRVAAGPGRGGLGDSGFPRTPQEATRVRPRRTGSMSGAILARGEG